MNEEIKRFMEAFQRAMTPTTTDKIRENRVSRRPRADDGLDYSEMDLKMRVFTDGTNTVAQLVWKNAEGNEELAGVGRARRAPGDKRDFQLGASLAVRRAYDDAIRTERKTFGEG